MNHIEANVEEQQNNESGQKSEPNNCDYDKKQCKIATQNVSNSWTTKNVTPINATTNALEISCKRRLYDAILAHIHLLPLISAILIPFLCVTIYIESISRDHVEPIFPYVSDTGTLAPEAGFFSQLMDIIVIFVFLSGIARYRQIKYYLEKLCADADDDTSEAPPKSNKDRFAVLRRLSYYNFAEFLLLFVSAFGFIMIGNFRFSELLPIHLVGVTIGFGTMSIYMILMIIINSRLAKQYAIESRPISMLIIVVFQTITIVLSFFAMFISGMQGGFQRVLDAELRLHWSSSEPGYQWHVFSTVLEWIAINLFSLFLFCMYNRMRQFHDWHKVRR